jgi:hypothetical protein
MAVSKIEQKIFEFLYNNSVEGTFTTKDFSKIVGFKVAPITMVRLETFRVLKSYNTKPKTYSVLTDEEGSTVKEYIENIK